jgi:mono/diheme cytochrome c family protein
MAWSALLFPAIISSAVGQETGDPAAGERLAAANCAQCHGAVQAVGGAPAFISIAAMPMITEQSLNVFLQTPHASMPNLILSKQDRDDLIAYIMSLRP